MEFIIGAYKNKIITKNHLSEELYQYIIQNHKWDIYALKIKNTFIETKPNISIPKINYNFRTSFIDYLKIIIPVVVISLSLTLGFIFFMNHYNNQIKEILSTVLGYSLIIGFTILMLWAKKTHQL